MAASKRLSVATVRLVRLRTVVKELHTALSALTARHTERTANGTVKVLISAGTGSEFNDQYKQ